MRKIIAIGGLITVIAIVFLLGYASGVINTRNAGTSNGILNQTERNLTIIPIANLSDMRLENTYYYGYQCQNVRTYIATNKSITDRYLSSVILGNSNGTLIEDIISVPIVGGEAQYYLACNQSITSNVIVANLSTTTPPPT